MIEANISRKQVEARNAEKLVFEQQRQIQREHAAKERELIT